MASCETSVAAKLSPRMVTRRGRFSRHWAARCACGWRGPGRAARWEAVYDARAHRGVLDLAEPV